VVLGDRWGGRVFVVLFVQLLGFLSFASLSGCVQRQLLPVRAVLVFCRGVRRIAWFYCTGYRGTRLLPFLAERGCGPTGIFLFWLCDKEVVLSQLRRLDASFIIRYRLVRIIF
jgi:hypothetical protein